MVGRKGLLFFILPLNGFQNVDLSLSCRRSANCKTGSRTSTLLPPKGSLSQRGSSFLWFTSVGPSGFTFLSFPRHSQCTGTDRCHGHPLTGKFSGPHPVCDSSQSQNRRRRSRDGHRGSLRPQWLTGRPTQGLQSSCPLFLHRFSFTMTRP